MDFLELSPDEEEKELRSAFRKNSCLASPSSIKSVASADCKIGKSLLWFKGIGSFVIHIMTCKWLLQTTDAILRWTQILLALNLSMFCLSIIELLSWLDFHNYLDAFAGFHCSCISSIVTRKRWHCHHRSKLWNIYYCPMWPLKFCALRCWLSKAGVGSNATNNLISLNNKKSLHELFAWLCSPWHGPFQNDDTLLTEEVVKWFC